MHDKGRIDLVFFEGCPNADQPRKNIRAAAELVGLPSERIEWSEWDLMSEAMPDALKRHGFYPEFADR